jgi:hypothetical protein
MPSLLSGYTDRPISADIQMRGIRVAGLRAHGPPLISFIPGAAFPHLAVSPITTKWLLGAEVGAADWEWRWWSNHDWPWQ